MLLTHREQSLVANREYQETTNKPPPMVLYYGSPVLDSQSFNPPVLVAKLLMAGD